MDKRLFDELFFTDEELNESIWNYLTLHLVSLLYHYKTKVESQALEFPTGIPPDKWQLIHWISEDMGLGSLVKGKSQGRGSGKWIFVGHFSVAENQFKKDFERRQKH